jgi:tyrosinase
LIGILRRDTNLLQQELYKLADAIARMFSNATERLLYQQAASEFRIPYWDWASPAPAGRSHFPEVFWNSTMTQYGPNGVQIIRNPLYSYSFHPLDEDAFIWPPVSMDSYTMSVASHSLTVGS